eukprot:1422955-Prymnesium_polylepis.2
MPHAIAKVARKLCVSLLMRVETDSCALSCSSPQLESAYTSMAFVMNSTDAALVACKPAILSGTVPHPTWPFSSDSDGKLSLAEAFASGVGAVFAPEFAQDILVFFPPEKR